MSWGLRSFNNLAYIKNSWSLYKLKLSIKNFWTNYQLNVSFIFIYEIQGIETRVEYETKNLIIQLRFNVSENYHYNLSSGFYMCDCMCERLNFSDTEF